jgi:hypothetical protein
MKHQTVVMAPHDDGFGAFSILARLARALKCVRPSLRLIFVSGRWSEPQLEEFGLGPPEVELVEHSNLVRLPKDESTGGVDVAKLAQQLPDALANADQWGPPEQDLDWKNVTLAISMGVPWLHRVAEKRGIPCVEVGDMCWSIVLREILTLDGRLTRETASLLGDVASCERKASEAWLLPFAAPHAYVDHFSSAAVPVNWIPGVFSSQDPDEDSNRPFFEEWRRKTLQDRPDVGVHAGHTDVWADVVRNLKNLPSGGPGDPAFTTAGFQRSPRRTKLEVLEHGGATTTAPQMASLIPLYATQDLGVTRGGITVLDHIAARCPLAITEEPNHWLSDRQRSAALTAGVCLPLSLSAFRSDPRGTTAKLLARSDELETIRLRMAAVPTGAERPLAEYLAHRFL